MTYPLTPNEGRAEIWLKERESEKRVLLCVCLVSPVLDSENFKKRVTPLMKYKLKEPRFGKLSLKNRAKTQLAKVFMSH